MTQAARGSGQRPPQNPDQQQRDSRESGERQARQSASFYEPLPLGSDAYMAPLAPAREPSTSALRKIALWSVLGTLAGASAGGIVLAFFLERAGPAPERDIREAVTSRASMPAAHAAEKVEAPRVLAAHGTLERADAPAPAPAPAIALPNPAQDAAEPQTGTEPAAAARAIAAEPPSRARRSSDRRSQPAIDKPSRADVLAAMARVQPAVKACLPGGRGLVTADITILGRTGRISNAHVSGQVGPVGSCVARAVRKARFPKFKAESINIRYPMQH